LDAILERATRIGEAKFGIIYRFDGEVFRVQAMRDATRPSSPICAGNRRDPT
jgi:hypothetical protein